MTAILKKRHAKTAVAILIALICLITAVMPVSAAVPKITAPITSKNVLSLLKTYDQDGYYLVTQGKKNGSDYMAWFAGQPNIVNGLDTAVHEQCHACTLGWQSEKIYRGRQKFYTVRFTSVYNTQKMASSIPKRLRTFRYNTYISRPIENLAANIQGVYGLLNEFSAYCWGMNNTVSMFPYYKRSGTDFDNWVTFINLGANDRLAYGEFTYYILHYLYYAKEHYPKVYKQIMKNSSFKTAYKYIDKKFRANINAYEKDLQKAVRFMNSSGHNAHISGGYFWCDGYGVGTFSSDYNKLCREINKSKYQKIYKKLIS